MTTNYRALAQEQADNFLKHCTHPSASIAKRLEQVNQQTASENRERLVPIIKTIILCGRLGIPLRGHRDDGKLKTDEAASGIQGNFRALLAFRVDNGDTMMAEHLKSSSKKATYVCLFV